MTTVRELCVGTGSCVSRAHGDSQKGSSGCEGGGKGDPPGKKHFLSSLKVPGAMLGTLLGS